MLISMTGFYSTSERMQFSGNRNTTITVEIKTLNSRFFEITAKLPGSLSNLELSLTALLQSKLTRGRVYLNINFDKRDASLEAIAPSFDLVQQYLDAAQQLKEKFKIDGALSIADVMHFPQALVVHDQKLDNSDEQKIIDLVARASDKLIEIRTQEGMRLEKDFSALFSTAAQKVALVEQTFASELERHKLTLKDVMTSLPAGEQSNSQIEELQLVLKKMDIHEEITRFKSHLDGVTAFLKVSTVEKGKRLDFTLQELLRETNTMMAKSSAFPISTACIDIKVELEKAREQVQNIV